MNKKVIVVFTLIAVIGVGISYSAANLMNKNVQTPVASVVNQSQPIQNSIPVNNLTASTPPKSVSTTAKPATPKSVSTTAKKTSTKNTSNVKVSASEAKVVASNHLGDTSFSVGTPVLGMMANIPTYFVPVIQDGITVGEIFVDAQNGECTGGTA